MTWEGEKGMNKILVKPKWIQLFILMVATSLENQKEYIIFKFLSYLWNIPYCLFSKLTILIVLPKLILKLMYIFILYIRVDGHRVLNDSQKINKLGNSQIYNWD